MTYRELWQSLIPVCGQQEAQAVVRLLLGSMFGLSLADIITFSTDSLPSADRHRLSAAMNRLIGHEPVQYVLGYETFLGRKFTVNPAVLIPRPETEQLVSMAESCSGRSVLDIGTGSGCIAISVALDCPDKAVTAWDVSPEALLVAQDNAKRLGAKVNFELRDALNPPQDNGRWDVIVSNPPYVCNSEKAQMEQNVLRFEPAGALFVPDSDPLLFYRAIAVYARKALRRGGSLLFECNKAFAADVAQMLGSMGFRDSETIDDQFGMPRFVNTINT